MEQAFRQNAPTELAEPAVAPQVAVGVVGLDRVLQGRPIPGLYAAGESSGGVLGDRIFGGGSSMCNVLVYGRIAGRNAARANSAG